MVEVKESNNYYWAPQSCPICKTALKRRLGRRGGAAHRALLGVQCEIWRCDRCGLIFPDPMPVPVNGFGQHYGVEANEYFEHHQIDERGVSAANILRQAEQLTKGKGKLLDIGSGRGELLRAARAAGWEVTGIEPSETFAEFAVAHSGAKIVPGPLEQCDFPENSFDCVILSAVLEHLYNPDETIAEIVRILRRGGAVFIDVPNEHGLYFVVGNLYQKLRGRDWVVNLAPTFRPYHVFGFSPRSLRALLDKHGLKPYFWKVYPGRAMVPSRPGLVGLIEKFAAKTVTAISRFGSLGTYIETWAVK